MCDFYIIKFKQDWYKTYTANKKDYISFQRFMENKELEYLKALKNFGI